MGPGVPATHQSCSDQWLGCSWHCSAQCPGSAHLRLGTAVPTARPVPIHSWHFSAQSLTMCLGFWEGGSGMRLKMVFVRTPLDFGTVRYCFQKWRGQKLVGAIEWGRCKNPGLAARPRSLPPLAMPPADNNTVAASLPCSSYQALPGSRASSKST